MLIKPASEETWKEAQPFKREERMGNFNAHGLKKYLSCLILLFFTFNVTAGPLQGLGKLLKGLGKEVRSHPQVIVRSASDGIKRANKDKDASQLVVPFVFLAILGGCAIFSACFDKKK